MYYEVVYETGRSSIINGTEEEALRAMGEQHRRARQGEASLSSVPESPPAERIVKAFAFDKHPNEWNPTDTLTADELKSALPPLVDSLTDDNGVVAVGVFAQEVRALTHPMSINPGPHESNYKMEPVGEITQAQIDAAADTAQAAIDAANAVTAPPSEPEGAGA